VPLRGFVGRIVLRRNGRRPLNGLSRRTAAEFSFFLAIPALLATTADHIWRARDKFIAADFAWYRIIFGAIILITVYTGVVNW
jgi:undecaprenyl-diphosphatase